MLVVLAAAFLIKVSAPELPWGLDYRAGTVQPTAAILSDYCAQARGNDLIVLEVADDLYASVLPLARLRYATVVPVAAPAGPYNMPFAEMGITVTVDQFNHLARYTPAFRARLREWGLDSSAPIATLITARTAADLTALVRAHPESDFLIPGAYRECGGVRPAGSHRHGGGLLAAALAHRPSRAPLRPPGVAGCRAEWSGRRSRAGKQPALSAYRVASAASNFFRPPGVARRVLPRRSAAIGAPVSPGSPSVL